MMSLCSQIEPMELDYILVLCSKLLLCFINGTNLAAKGMDRTLQLLRAVVLL